MRGLFDDPIPRKETTEERFLRFHAANPRVYDLFKRFVWQLRNQGRTRYSARTILERIRWEYAVTTASEDQFKINDHFIPWYARLMIKDHPMIDGFFELRVMRTP